MTELNKPSDEFDIFGEFVASEIRSLQLDHNRRKLKRIIQKAILDMSEIDEDESSRHLSTPLSTHSKTSVSSKESENSIYSIYSPPPAINPIQSQPQISNILSIPHSSFSCTDTSSTSQDYQELGK